MRSSTSGDRLLTPVVRGVSYVLAHVPSSVRYGSKPSREIGKDPSLLQPILEHLRSFDEATCYAPNQVFVGNMSPDDLWKVPLPWYKNPVLNASPSGFFGEIISEEDFYGFMKICDDFEILLLEENFLRELVSRLSSHCLFCGDDIRRLNKGVSLAKIKNEIDEASALPIYINGDQLVGCLRKAHEEDASLIPEVLIENLAARASGMLALRHLISRLGQAGEIEYLLGCGEEAVGDRYNRGGGSLSKAIGELCGCTIATGSDVKAFCCSPLHAMVIGAGLIGSGIFNNVVVVGGGSFAKLGMKFQGHLRNKMPIIEDVLASVAILLGIDDGKSPIIRLDSIGKHEISSGSAQQAILEKLVVEPLNRLGLKLTEVNKYATEMHNPEITEPQGSGNVPMINYRIIGSFGVLSEEIKKGDLDHFVKLHGMPGFSPTQGHIASAIPVLGHSILKITQGEWHNTMFLAKGSLFLGLMTQLADGISFLLERNKGGN